MPLVLVMVGGALGSGARYLTGRAALSLFGPNFPYGTLAVNLIGGLLMGALAGSLVRAAGSGEAWRLFVGVGVLGILAVLVGVPLVWCFGAIIVAALSPVFYSLVLYKQLERQGKL